MQNSPHAPDLLDIAAEVLRREIVPALEGTACYHARIAANLVAMVARELRLAPAANRCEAGRLRALLDTMEGDVATLNRTLTQRLRDGAMTIDDPSVARHLIMTVMAKLAIDNPDFARLSQQPNPS